MFSLFTSIFDHLVTLFFGALVIFSAFLVLVIPNPVHSVLFLVLSFCAGSVVLMSYGAEFLSVGYVVVYVGAIAVLFLFVVMMLAIRMDIADPYGWYRSKRYLFSGFFLGFFTFLAVISVLVRNDSVSVYYVGSEWVDFATSVSNTIVLGQLLYTYGSSFFLISGMILLVAMVGSIMLTLFHRKGVKRQEIHIQVHRPQFLTFYKTFLFGFVYTPVNF